MAKAKRQITFKKKKVVEQENSVTTIPQNTESNTETDELNNVPTEVEKQAQNVLGDDGSDDELSAGTVIEEEEIIVKSKWDIIGDVGGSKIIKPQWRIKFEAQVAPVPMFMLPEDIRRYLQSHWLSSDVFKKDKEWLEKHNVDMGMVDKLKKFLTERL